MKRIRCPKCDEPILFDEKNYELGRTLVFECKACHKQFKIRLRRPSDVNEEEAEGPQPVATLVVIENAFHLKQEIPLYEGENVIGRHVRGTKANAAIKTVDPSVDTTHCVITIKPSKAGDGYDYFLRDAGSNTGTFLMNNLLYRDLPVRIEAGNIITIGATTMILRTNDGGEEEQE